MKFPKVRESLALLPLGEMLERSAALYGPKIGLRKRTGTGWQEYTYSDLFSLVKRISGYLIFKGCAKGDFIGILGENSPEWVMAFMAVQWIGAVAIPLDPRAKETELRHIFDHSNPKALFCSPKGFALVQRMKETGDLKKDVILVSLQKREGRDHVPAILESFKDDSQKATVSLEDLAIIQYTSGTSGSPKAVMLSHRNISSNINSLYQAVYFDQKDHFFSVLPIHHVYEGTAGNWLPLSVGASITYSRSLKSKEMMEDVRESEPTVVLAVPLLLEKVLLGIRKRLSDLPAYLRALIVLVRGCASILDRVQPCSGSRIFFGPLRRQMGFGKLRFFVSGGAALPASVQKGLEDFGFGVLQGYGLSETAPVLTLNPLTCPRSGSIGVPVPDVEIRILDPDPEGRGEIAAKGPNIMPGYYKDEQMTRAAFTSDGFFLTGDVGYRAPDGFFFITGRKKSVIVTKGGEKVFPEEIEHLMLGSPYIEEMIVLRGHHPKTGSEEVHAIIYPSLEQLKSHFPDVNNPSAEDKVRKLLQKEMDDRASKLAPYKRITHFTIRWEEFPKTTSNKIKRYLFEERGPDRKADAPVLPNSI